MAQRHVDITQTQDIGAITDAANAETLTNTVRIVFDNTTPLNDILITIDRAKAALLRIYRPRA